MDDNDYKNVIDMSGAKNSHMYFPNFIIKAFYDEGAVNYLNAKKCKMLLSENSEKYNVKRGYFSDETEGILNAEAETKFSQLLHRVTEFIESGSRDFRRIKVYKGAIYRFFAYQINRDPAITNARRDKLLEAGGIKIRERLPQETLGKKEVRENNPYREPSLREFQNIAINLEKNTNLDTKNLKDKYAVVLGLNYTKTEFIAVNAPIRIKYYGDEILALVASPRMAVYLVPKYIFNQLNLELIRCENSEFVFYVNECIMAHAIKHEPHEVLGTNQEYLISLCRETKSKIID